MTHDLEQCPSDSKNESVQTRLGHTKKEGKEESKILLNLDP